MVLTALIFLQSALCSQTVTNDSICFDLATSKKIIKDLNRLDYSDSIINTLHIQIRGFNELSLINDSLIAETDLRLLDVKKDLNKSNLKLKITLKLFKYSVPISIGGGLYLGYLLFN